MSCFTPNNLLCNGSFSGGEIEPGTFHGGEIEPGTFHAPKSCAQDAQCHDTSQASSQKDSDVMLEA